MKNIPVITIDGLSGVGKGVISRLLAEKLRWHLLDSGAIYRILALVVIRNKIPLDNILLIVAATKELRVQFTSQAGLQQKIVLAEEDITSSIRSEECGSVASKISSFGEVRAALIAYQHSFCQPPGLVADGRDMGTVVFPGAKLKFFLTAHVEERAKRRLLQLQDQGINATLSTVLKDLTERDLRDQKQSRPDSAAVIIDTTKLSIGEVLQQILVRIQHTQF